MLATVCFNVAWLNLIYVCEYLFNIHKIQAIINTISCKAVDIYRIQSQESVTITMSVRSLTVALTVNNIGPTE